MDDHPVSILLVDDDEDDYILTRDLLSEIVGAQLSLDWVSAYDAALEAIGRKQHDVYLVDYRLGNRNGLELLREALARGCQAPIILLTGQGDREVDIEAMKAGAADFLDKGQLRAPLLERSIRYALERKQAEQKIREQAALLDITTDAILVQSLDSKIIFWNKGAERLYGWQAEEAINRNYYQLLYKIAPNSVDIAYKAVLQKGKWQGEFHQTTKDKQEIIVASRWTLVQDEEEQPKSILIVNTDITEKKQLEAQFLRTQRMESLGTLAGGIAHDLNNVLAPMLMAVQFLESKIEDEWSRELLKILEINARRGADLVRQVLSFARGLEGERTILQTRHLITEIKQIVKETFPKSIEIYTDIPNNLWTVYGDATQLHQVLMNLCVNARDAMPSGGALNILAENFFIDESYVQVDLGAQVGPYIVITVTDTGTGIPPAILDRIFEPFFTTKEINKGTGLGLSTVSGIIKSHGGFITVNSQLGQGTEFKVYLPAVESPEMEIPGEPELIPGQGELVLFVDDEASVREITKTLLEANAYRVLTASDGIEAITQYAQHKSEISVVLTDMMMPSMDGLTTIRMLQKIDAQVKIVAVSGLASSDKMAETLETGVNIFLWKPYTAEELLKTLHHVLHEEGEGVEE